LLYLTVNIDVSDRISGTVERKGSMSKSKALRIEILPDPEI
jgi:hypothetical protein